MEWVGSLITKIELVEHNCLFFWHARKTKTRNKRLRGRIKKKKKEDEGNSSGKKPTEKQLNVIYKSSREQLHGYNNSPQLTAESNYS
jgi:hypothetical protein